ncbi:MAG: hypothetical protein IIU77_04365 [Clostridia bacterium]|nr:hypothetical protein [Clostridia bacterium]
MSLVKLKYEVLVSGIYPFEGTWSKNGFTIVNRDVNNDSINALFDLGILYISPYIFNCCYPNENKQPVYLTLHKETIIDIDYGDTDKYDRKFTTNYIEQLDLLKEIDDMEKLMTLEINNYIKFPVKIIKAFDPDGNQIAMIGNFSRINIPSLLGNNISMIKEVMDRQNNRLSSGFSYEKIIELKSTNTYFDNALSIYFSSFSVADEKIGFVLLITALESLLNLSTYSTTESCESCGQPKYKIRATISENVSLMLMDTDDSIKKEVKKLYDKRSKYVHMGIQDITETDELILQEYTRKVLLMYWYISMQINTNDHKAIIQEIHSSGYNSKIMYQTFLTALQNNSFEEKKKRMIADIMRGIINGTIKFS